jgi:hypothetical protein
MATFYTYMWLREDGTPYYIGKGTGRRAYRKGSPPTERIILQEWSCEEEALEVEKFLIAFYGRRDLGTGCLYNGNDGGFGGALTGDALRRMGEHQLGRKHSEETRRKMRLARAGQDRSGIGALISAAKKGRPSGKKGAVVLSLRGKKRPPFSAEWRQNISLAMQGKTPWNKGLHHGNA